MSREIAFFAFRASVLTPLLDLVGLRMDFF